MIFGLSIVLKKKKKSNNYIFGLHPLNHSDDAFLTTISNRNHRILVRPIYVCVEKIMR